MSGDRRRKARTMRDLGASPNLVVRGPWRTGVCGMKADRDAEEGGLGEEGGLHSEVKNLKVS